MYVSETILGVAPSQGKLQGNIAEKRDVLRQCFDMFEDED